MLDGELPDGILVEGTKAGLPNPNLDLYRKLISRGVPMVFMHGIYPELSDCLSVLDDNYGGGRQLVEYLYKKGHRSIAGIFKNDDFQGLQRYAGYADALRDLGLPLEDQRVFWYNTESKERLLSDNNSWEQVTDMLHNCTAVVCYNDEIASRLVSLLLGQGRASRTMWPWSASTTAHTASCPSCPSPPCPTGTTMWAAWPPSCWSASSTATAANLCWPPGP